MDSSELIELFYNRAYEKFVNKQILDDKNYIVPRQQLTNYVHELVNIPYNAFIDHIKKNGIDRIVEASDVTQFSSFSSCEIEMCNALIWANNPGCQYIDIGRYFPNKIFSRNDSAYRRYGENHIKASTQLGLTFEYYNYWYLSCLGYIYPDLSENIRKKLLARTITRNRLYQQLLIDILDHDVNPERYMDMLSEQIMKRRLRNVCVFFDICLTECNKENIKIYNLIKSYEFQKPTVLQIPTETNRNLCKYLKEFDYRTLSNKTTSDLIKRYRKGDTKAFDLLLKGYMRLVVTIAKTYNHKGVELEDLIQEGVIGLISAFKHYNENIYAEFSKYAQWWIRQSITKALITIPHIVRIPINVITLHQKVWKYIDSFEQEHGFLPSIANIDFCENYDLEWINYLCQLPSDLKNLTCAIDNFDIFESNSPKADEFQEKEYKIYYAKRLLHLMNTRDQIILARYYGLDGNQEGETLYAIGDYFNLTRERVRQILVKSIEHLRKVSENNTKLPENLESQFVVKSFEEATIGEYVNVPNSIKIGKIIDIQKSGDSQIYILLTEDKKTIKYNQNGTLIYSTIRKPKQITPEREAFIKNFYSKKNNSLSNLHILPQEIETNENKTIKSSSKNFKEKRNSNTNKVNYNNNIAKIGDRILFDSKYYTILGKRSMGGFSRLIARCDDGTLTNLPNDKNRYTIL